MSSRTCPDWPQLMEIAPDLQFKHYTVAEAQLPFEALSKMSGVSLSDVSICCDLEHERARLREPEAVLLDQVDREPVRAGRPRPDEPELQLDDLARLNRLRERRPLAVPDDRVPERVEPVRAELDALAAARAPRRRARVLEQHARHGRLTGPDRRHLVRVPADGERTGGDGMLADSLHGGTSVGRMA